MQTLNSLYFELRFVSLHRKFATSNFVITNNQRSSLIFREESNEIFLESSLIFRSKFARTKGEFRRISFAFLLHNTVCYRCDDLSGQEETRSLSTTMRRYRENKVMLRFVTMVKFTSNGVKTLQSTFIKTIKNLLECLLLIGFLNACRVFLCSLLALLCYFLDVARE